MQRGCVAVVHDDGEGNHEIEEIVALVGGEFMLKWKGDYDNTLQPPEDLAGCLDSVMDFLNEVIHPLKLRVIRSRARRNGALQRTAAQRTAESVRSGAPPPPPPPACMLVSVMLDNYNTKYV